MDFFAHTIDTFWLKRMFDRKLHFLRHLDGVLKIEKIMALDIVKFKERIFFNFEKYCTSGK